MGINKPVEVAEACDQPKTKKQKQKILYRKQTKKTKKIQTPNRQQTKTKTNKSFRQKMKTTTERATPVPTLVLMKARHLCGESRGASSPKSNQSKQVQVTSLAYVPDRCQATQKDTNPRGDHEPTTMTSLHPVTLLTNFALNFAYIKK